MSAYDRYEPRSREDHINYTKTPREIAGYRPGWSGKFWDEHEETEEEESEPTEEPKAK